MSEKDVAGVPMPETVGTRFDGTRLLKEADVRTYGDAREAAGYARGLADGQGHCRRLTETDKAQAAAALRGDECDLPPRGWRCTRGKGHSGPCAAVECPEEIEIVERAMARLRGEVK